MVNRLVVFFCRHEYFTDVEIKGVFDMDFFETSQAVKYYNQQGRLQYEIPVNPYHSDDSYHNLYEELKNAVISDAELEELLSECVYGIENHHRSGYDLEMEALKWQ